MSALDLDALEAKARAATPGPWTHDQRSMVCVGSDGIADDCRWDDAAFIAACDPTTVLALITSLRAAEARIERVGAILSDEGCDCYCDCDSHHNADCELCLACRIDREVSP